jgi:hypothetical protein
MRYVCILAVVVLCTGCSLFKEDKKADLVEKAKIVIEKAKELAEEMKALEEEENDE